MFGSRFFHSDFFGSSPFDDPFFSTPRTQQPQQHSGVEPSSRTNPTSSSQDSASSSSPSQTVSTRNNDQRLVNRDLWDDFGMGWGGFGDFQRSFNRMQRRMDQMMQQMDRMGLDFEARAPISNSSSFSSSSVSQGGEAPFVKESRHEYRRLGDVTEEHIVHRDSTGNEKNITRRALGNRSHEVIAEKNAKGETRQHENMKDLQPEELQKFNQEWEAARLKVDPEHKLLKGTSSALPALKAGQTPSAQPTPTKMVEEEKTQATSKVAKESQPRIKQTA